MYNKTKVCGISDCTFPEGECRQLCWHPEERQMSLFDEDRADIIGQNGNEGLHYPRNGSVRVTVMEGGKVDLEYIASWTDNRKDVLERASRLIQVLIKEEK